MGDSDMHTPWKMVYFLEPGLVMPVIVDAHSLRTAVKDFEVRDDDVFLVTYPKAGTSWVCEIVDAIINVDNLEVLKTRALIEKTPLLEFGPSNHPDLLAEGIEGLPSVIETIHKPAPSPRRIPTHLFPKYCPTQLFTKKPKTIFLDRNPKDLLASLFAWHHSLRFLPLVEWNSFFEAHMKGHLTYGSYTEFTRAWYDYKDEPWFYWTRYEDLKKDPRGSVKKIAEFLGKDLTDKQLNDVLRVTSFEYMKKAGETIRGRDFILRPHGEWQRKGKVGGWKNIFTVAQNEAFNRDYDERMKKLGIEHMKYKF
ncbi:sulfotransferase 1A2-like [Ptychodera flava]|uniref:sulfotransferase 1A2-like n=1 Tax=Ptychodera flava TaxID=63121 RepID=UPI00396A30B4